MRGDVLESLHHLTSAERFAMAGSRDALQHGAAGSSRVNSSLPKHFPCFRFL